MTAAMQLATVADGLGFAEGLRWHDGALWFSDFITRKVHTLDAAGFLTQVAFVPGQPSGLGFAPDGTPLVVSMLDQKLLAIAPEQLSVVANLSNCSAGPCNDMLVDARGHAYIGCFGFELWYEARQATQFGTLVHVNPEGVATVAADGLRTPNGMAILPGGKTLVVAETHACQLTAFDIAADGSLSRPRLFARLGERHPDGICVNADGDIWVACLYASEFLLVREGGAILDRVATPGRWAVACALGGATGQRLFCATTSVSQPNDMRLGRSRSAIGFVDVAVAAP